MVAKIITGLLAVIFLISGNVYAKSFGAKLCEESKYYTCYTVGKGETWQKLFPEEEQRDLVMRINRMNIQPHAGMVIAVPISFDEDPLAFAPFPQQIDPPGTKLVLVDKSDLAFGAYDGWKIQGMQLSSGPTGQAINVDTYSPDPVTDPKGAQIHGILVNEKADSQGYVEDETLTVSKDAKRIYATVQVVAPIKGMKVTATLTHLGGGKIGPTTAKVNNTGNILKAFSFTRTTKEWPPGEYKINVELSTGAKKSIIFNVQ